MISIDKRTTAPAILRRRGVATTDAMKVAYDAAGADYRSGTRTFDFDSSLYGATSVKKALIADQHHKCCFCEAKITHVAYGDVEHFRPKKAFKQKAADPYGRPGYYWLAYDWSNLFLSCQICNQRHKKNLFPLIDPGQRALDHHADLKQESALFVAPDEQPADHITFANERATGRTERGQTTIDELGLNRPELVEHRLTRLRPASLLVRALGQLPPGSGLATEIRAQIDALKRDTAEYAGMHRANLP